MLQSEFTVRPLDAVESATLAGAWLMLVAQPRGLAPEELVALDAWVRAGGRALILIDPQLVWPSRWPLGDVRRPPPVGLLDPLLAHWGLRLDPADEAAVLIDEVPVAGRIRRLSLAAPGQFAASGPACALAGRSYLARCRIGRGEALLVADADLLRDAMWAGAGDQGDARHLRLADNPLVIADWLDRLSGFARERVAAPVQWLAPGSDRTGALVMALVPLLLASAGAFALRLRHS